jgi:hypothetical protein
MTGQTTANPGQAGRRCPRDYRYPPSVFDRPAEFAAEVLYVVGGLYGNHPALDAVEALVAEERAPATIVFSRIDLFASTHTCLAALRDIALPSGRLSIMNNGAAGMPNFASTRFGLVTRIATRPPPSPALYGIMRRNVHINAIALHHDCRAFLDRFLARGPEGSPAHASYFRRIDGGPDHAIADARRAAA